MCMRAAARAHARASPHATVMTSSGVTLVLLVNTDAQASVVSIYLTEKLTASTADSKNYSLDAQTLQRCYIG